MQRVMDMIVSSFLAIGEDDSVKYYIGIYRSMFPNLDFDKFGIRSPLFKTKPCQTVGDAESHKTATHNNDFVILSYVNLPVRYG